MKILTTTRDGDTQMADLPPYSGSNTDANVGPGLGSTTSTPRYPGTPRWVKVSGIVALVVILLVVIVMFASGGSHGPARHIPSGDAGGSTPPIARVMQRP